MLKNMTTAGKPWYKKWWGIVVAIAILPYFLLWFIWTRSRLSKLLKIASSVALLALVGIYSYLCIQALSNPKKTADVKISASAKMGPTVKVSKIPVDTLNSEAKEILLPVTNSYIQLYDQGSVDATANNTSSYLTWSDSFISTNDPRLNASLTAYNKALSIYKSANISPPPALKSWFEDNENVYTDISEWSTDEEADLANSYVSSNVVQDLQTYNNDLSSTQKDLNNLAAGSALQLATIPKVSSPPASASSTANNTAPSLSCYPQTDSGGCYNPGEYCRTADQGTSGISEDGESITCEDNDGWRWEAS